MLVSSQTISSLSGWRRNGLRMITPAEYSTSCRTTRATHLASSRYVAAPPTEMRAHATTCCKQQSPGSRDVTISTPLSNSRSPSCDSPWNHRCRSPCLLRMSYPKSRPSPRRRQHQRQHGAPGRNSCRRRGRGTSSRESAPSRPACGADTHAATQGRVRPRPPREVPIAQLLHQ